MSSPKDELEARATGARATVVPIERGQRDARSRKPRRTPADDGNDARAVIKLGPATREEDTIDNVVHALRDEERLFTRGPSLVRVLPATELPNDLVHRDEDRASIERLPISQLRGFIDRRVRFVVPDDDGTRDVGCTDRIAKAVDERHHWPGLRHLEAVVETPVLLADGSVLASRGYHPSGLYLDGDPIDVPTRPSASDLRGALALFADLVGSFSFHDDAHRSAALAAAMTPIARFAFSGPSPAFLFDANTRGTGKTLLARNLGVIATGRAVPLDSLPTKGDTVQDAELEKRTLTWAIAGRRVVCLDNVKVPLGGAEIERATTATTVGGRVLGVSVEWTGPLFAAWFITGNNVVIAGDMDRRLVHVRLLATCERPEDRTFTRDLDAYVRAERRQLTRALLVILRAYCAAGRPRQTMPPFGSYEGWSDLVRAAIVWADWPDPVASRAELLAVSADQRNIERALVLAWRAATSARRDGITVAQFFGALDKQADAPGALAALATLDAMGVSRETTTRGRDLGRVLGTLRDRVYTEKGTNLAIARGEDAGGGVARWLVKEGRP